MGAWGPWKRVEGEEREREEKRKIYSSIKIMKKKYHLLAYMCITIMGQFEELIIIMLLRKGFCSAAQTQN